MGNAYTFASNAVGSLVKIGSDPNGCGTPGTFSTGSTALSFLSTVTIGDIIGSVGTGFTDLLNTLKGTGDNTTPVATLQGATVDGCIKRLESLAVQARPLSAPLDGMLQPRAGRLRVVRAGSTCWLSPTASGVRMPVRGVVWLTRSAMCTLIGFMTLRHLL